MALVVQNSPANVADMNSIPRSGRSPGVGNGNSLQASCPENAMDREAWQAIIHRVAKSQMQLRQLSTHRVWQGKRVEKDFKLNPTT